MCLFVEPWVGECKKPAPEGQLCCEEHSKEKCHVCGEQATTRCQASRGLMCGIPMCHLCGAGEMCIHHAGDGPLMVIKALLGGGPEPSPLATRAFLIEQAEKMKAVVEHVRQFSPTPTMEAFEKAKKEWEEEK